MVKDIEENIKSCRGCTISGKASQVKFTPWLKTDRLHIDFAGQVKGQYYLIVFDSFSKLPEVRKCKNPTYNGTIKFLLEHFARFGIPAKIVSDKGIQFTTKELKDFC